jgi:chemotaxis protein MotB
MRKAPRIERAGHDRWLVSYADLVTLLLAFFTTLYAASNLDATKMAPLSSSLQQAFANEAAAAASSSTSTSTFTSTTKERLAPLPALGVFPREHTLDNLRMTLEQQLAQAVKNHDVDVAIDPARPGRVDAR